MALAEARAALAACNWPRARDLLDDAVTATPSAEAERLDALGEALWWLGRIDECIEARVRAYALFGQHGAHTRAGQAVDLAVRASLLPGTTRHGGWLAATSAAFARGGQGVRGVGQPPAAGGGGAPRHR